MAHLFRQVQSEVIVLMLTLFSLGHVDVALCAEVLVDDLLLC